MERRKIAGAGSPQELATYFQIVGGNRMNGVFVVASEGRHYQLLFYDGKLIYVEPEPARRDEALVEYFLEAKIIEEDEEESILKEKKKRRVSIVTVVAERKGDVERIRKAMYARTFEAIFEITQFPLVKFEFIEKRKNEIGFNPKIFRPLSVENIVMEAMRISDELSTVPEEARNEYAVPVMVEKIAQEEFRRMRIPPEVAGYIDGRRNIREIAREMCVSKYEVMLYVGELMKRGYVDIEGIKEIKREEKVKRNVFVLVLKNILSVLILLGMAGGSYYFRTRNEVGIVSFKDKREAEVNVVKGMIKLKTALYAYRVIYRDYPESLSVLAEKGFVADEDLTFPIKKLYYYKKENERYELLP